ncbi:hypothetical protein BCU70_01825 [Vibrio sp. 10N.286.49.C2]|uniref:helix-turn-helix transcriptional regulator n=1 Tax=unclassified Vibrio TaxID=2614977 RepID=UPI000C834905|nr:MULTISPECIES: AraC family transcriptional regulator [unclassified Vibrio]PMH42918.1 hypothetical protein BCU70_01825 [Vibrio sp. 10N.286.49.C2]PMH53743.1 hypothetical protein BCU66_13010 [Vibrio sp. 10N.286.49.B1]PMH84076.1 hypothetical protein BCU58_01340 [Vibrio sp. 10N.286.48.B7]
MKNQPLVIKHSVSCTGLSIRSFWDVYGDEQYQNTWPQDRRLPMAENTLVIIYSESGNGYVNLKDGTTLRLRGNCVLCLDPFSIVHYGCDGLIWKLYWTEVFLDPSANVTIPYQKVIPIDNHRHFEIQFNELIEALRQDNPYFSSFSAAIYNKMFYEWLLYANNQHLSKPQLLVQKVIDEMHHNLSSNWKVMAMAEFSNCSEQHLRKLFIEHTTYSPKDYYQRLKLDIAYSLIRKGKKNVTQIAYDLGFTDAFHLSNSFKKQFGLPPSQVTTIAAETQQIVSVLKDDGF